MTENNLKRFASPDIITHNLDKIIEAFVSFYGEDRRSEIVERLNNTLILKYTNISSLGKNIGIVKKNILMEIYDDSNLEVANVDALYNILTDKKDPSFWLSEGCRQVIFGKKDIDKEEIVRRYKNGEYPKLNEFIKKYDDVLKSIRPHVEMYEKGRALEQKLNKKYFEKLIDEFKYLFPKSSMDYYQKYSVLSEDMYSYFNNDLSPNGHCFDSNSVKMLESEDVPEYKKNEIIASRLAFLNTNGFPYDTYERCLRDHKCKDFIAQSIDICSKISKRKKELYDAKTKEFVENWYDYNMCREVIDSKDYVYKVDSLGPSLYDNEGVSICDSNFISHDGELKYSPIVLINGGEFNDCVIIHELNHALETHTISIDGTLVNDISGWDYETYDIAAQSGQEKDSFGFTRNYEFISEYVNERLAEEITDKMHEQGNCIFSPHRPKNTCSYLVAKFLLEDFYTEFKDIIIQSRHNGNIDHLFNSVGKENFETLSDIVNAYYEKFGLGFTGKMAIADYYNEIDNDNSRLISDLVTLKNMTLSAMRNHLQNSREEENITR